MATWYVSPSGDDINSGTSAAYPFKTPQHAVNAAVTGDTVQIGAGSYRAPNPTSPILNVWAKKGITIAGPADRSAVLDGTGGCGGCGGIALLTGGSSSGIAVSGLTIVNVAPTNTGGGFGIWSAGTATAIAIGNTFSNIEISNTWNNGIRLYYAQGGVIDGLYVHGCCTQNLNGVNMTNSQWGQAVATQNSNGCIIRNCRVVNNWGEGIDHYGEDALATHSNQVINNIVINCWSVGIYMGAGKNNIVRGNTIYNDGATCWRGDYGNKSIAYATEAGQSPAGNDVVENNITIGGQNGFYYGSFGQSLGLQNITLRGNTFINPKAGAGLFIENSTAPSAGNVIDQNLFVIDNGLPAGISLQTPPWQGVTWLPSNRFLGCKPVP